MADGLEGQGRLVDYSGIVWVRTPYIMFNLAAKNFEEARALAEARFGWEGPVTVQAVPFAEPEEVARALYRAPGADDPYEKYLGRLYVDGKPVEYFSLMARNRDEAYKLALAKYGDYPIGVWKEGA